MAFRPIRKHDFPEHSGRPCFVCRKGIRQLHTVLICRSLTTAQKAARILQKAGIYSSVTKAPQDANPGGCTYGVKIAKSRKAPALEVLSKEAIRIEAAIDLPDGQGYGIRI